MYYMTKKKTHMTSTASNKITSFVHALDINFLLFKNKIEG